MTSAALLVMDIQQDVLARYADHDDYLARLGDAITAARDAGIPVMYVTVSFRPGHPEASPRNTTFAALAGTGPDREGFSPAGAGHHHRGLDNQPARAGSLMSAAGRPRVSVMRGPPVPPARTA